MYTDISKERTASNFREKLEVEYSSETAVNIYQTTCCNIPEDRTTQSSKLFLRHYWKKINRRAFRHRIMQKFSNRPAKKLV
jgi:hypothetical protein